MKEIDFIPDWYKSGRKKQIGYRMQYVVIGSIFAVMLVWNVVTSRSVSKAHASLGTSDSELKIQESSSSEYAELTADISSLQRQASIINEIDSRISLADVLAETSFLIDEKIMLTELNLFSQKFDLSTKGKTSGGAVLRKANFASSSRGITLAGDMRFAVVIKGFAAKPADVADLICKFEESKYFCQVIPSYSRNKEVRRRRAGSKQESLQVCEFEINCYIADYKVEQK